MVIVMTRLVYGVGINDSKDKTETRVNGVRLMCPFYRTWTNMLRRCYSDNYQSLYPTYIGCSVDQKWHTFSQFKSWMMTKDWNGKELDKDIIFSGNKVYSEEACAFIDRKTNLFVTEKTSARGDHPIGVSYHAHSKKYKSECGNPFSKKGKLLGYFDCPMKAHMAWKKRKHEIACQLADLQTDERVANALRERYA